mmetsp:Transcript_71021/g.200510  ORF Transcript_71021/g.200510 Transcript_71021/m.200510 type:complete len:262 (+) Transcript_71021:297-1082(+)
MPRSGQLRDCGAVVSRCAACWAELREHTLEPRCGAREPRLANQVSRPERRYQVLPGGPRPLPKQRECVLQPRRILREAAKTRQGTHQLQPRGALRSALCRSIQQHGRHLQGARKHGEGPQVLPHGAPVQPAVCPGFEQHWLSIHDDWAPTRGFRVPCACRDGCTDIRRIIQQLGLALLGPRRPHPGPADVREVHRAVAYVGEARTEPAPGVELSARCLALARLRGSPCLGRALQQRDRLRLRRVVLPEDSQAPPTRGLHFA